VQKNSHVSLSDLDLLSRWDTPTICNALELLNPALPLAAFTTLPGVTIADASAPMVGVARVGTIRSRERPASVAADRFDWYDYVGEANLPTIIVLQDLDEPAGAGSFWGEVHSKVHLSLGARGCVTNGSFRDVEAWAKGFRMLGGCLSPSHAHVHLVDFSKPVEVLGMHVEHDQIVHGDHYGAVVIPHDAVKKLPEAIEAIARREKRVLDLCDAANFSSKLMRSVLKQGHIH